MEEVMVGGCLCGQVRYRIGAKPLFTAVCHCRHCQRQSGSAFSLVVGVPAAALVVEGAVTAYADTSDVGRSVTRSFCGVCGSGLFSAGEGAPGVIFVKGGSLDDNRDLKPAMELWKSSAQPWLKLDPPLKAFDRQPER